MVARKHFKIQYVNQTKKIQPIITRETAFSQQVNALVFGVNIFVWDFGVSIMTLSDNQSNATLWVLDTTLIFGLQPLKIILITASLSSKIYNCASH